MSDPSYSFHFLILRLFAPSLSYFPVTFYFIPYSLLSLFHPITFSSHQFSLFFFLSILVFPSQPSFPRSHIHSPLHSPLLCPSFPSSKKNSTHSLLSDQYSSFPSFKPPHFLHTPFPSSLLPPSPFLFLSSHLSVLLAPLLPVSLPSRQPSIHPFPSSPYIPYPAPLELREGETDKCTRWEGGNTRRVNQGQDCSDWQLR